MFRNMFTACAAVLASALLITACSDNSRSITEPTPPPVAESITPSGCPTVAQTAQMIVNLYPARSGERLLAAASYAVVLLYVNLHHQADARTLVFRLLDFTLKQFNAGKLVGGGSAATRAQLLAFETGLYCTVGLPTTGLTLPGDPSDPGSVTQVVFPSNNTQTFVTLNGDAGIQLPPNSFNTPAVVVTISMIPNATRPLNTTLDQYGPFYDVKVTPEGALTTGVTVGICLDNGIEIPTVFLAHNVTQTVNNVPTPGIEILPPAGVIPGLCTDQTAMMPAHQMFDLAMNGNVSGASKVLGSKLADLVLPTNAYAGGGGKTGTTKAFSPFGGVDAKVYISTNPTPFPAQTSPAGAPVPIAPSTAVLTQNGLVVPKVNVTFAVTGGGGTVAGGSTSTVGTGANGIATVGDWTLGFGANSLQATGVFADPTVTFAAAPPNSGFPQAVAVSPANGVTFTATGSGDIVSYGSLYSFASGPQGFGAGFEVPGAPATGFATGNAPFGTPGSGCSIFNDQAFTLNPGWPVGTDLLLTKSFPLPASLTAPVTITAAIDNDIQVFVNGHPLTMSVTGAPLYQFVGPDAGNYSYNANTGFIVHENCATKGSLQFTVPTAFLNLGGSNEVAVRARDRGDANYVDLQISVTPPTQVP